MPETHRNNPPRPSTWESLKALGILTGLAYIGVRLFGLPSSKPRKPTDAQMAARERSAQTRREATARVCRRESARKAAEAEQLKSGVLQHYLDREAEHEAKRAVEYNKLMRDVYADGDAEEDT